MKDKIIYKNLTCSGKLESPSTSHLITCHTFWIWYSFPSFTSKSLLGSLQSGFYCHNFIETAFAKVTNDFHIEEASGENFSPLTCPLSCTDSTHHILPFFIWILSVADAKTKIWVQEVYLKNDLKKHNWGRRRKWDREEINAHRESIILKGPH